MAIVIIVCMKITGANVEKYAKEKGLEPIQIDGIPEGFAWIEPDLFIGFKVHKGRIIKFKPLGDWNKDITYEQRD